MTAKSRPKEKDRVEATARDCRFEERPEWSSWVTPKKLAGAPVHRWFVFPHSFSPQLVHALVGEWGLSRGDVLLDPFVGAGTTLVAARDAGLKAKGFDLSPLSELASRVKVSPPAGEELRAAWKKVERGIRVRRRLPTNALYEDLVTRAFPAELLPTLDATRRTILESSLGGRERDALLLALLGILPGFSRLVRRGGWLEERSHSLAADHVREEFKARVLLMVKDIERPGGEKRPRATVALADARNLPIADQSVSAVVTSPPYPNRHDYTRVFGVELQFAFLDWNSVRELRYQSFSSHPESKPRRQADSGYVEPPAVTDTVQAIGALIDDSREKKRIPRMLHGYFEDLFLSFREIRRTLRPKARAAMVLGNVSYCGIALEVDKLAIEVARQAQLDPVVVYVARRRGNSAQQMKRHGRRPQRESVLVFERPRAR